MKGERLARKHLANQGFEILGSVRNRSGHGIDLVGRAKNGLVAFFEVKTTEGLVAPALSKQQAMGAQSFVWDRLSRAVTKHKAWKAVNDPQTSAFAKTIRDELQHPTSIQGSVIEVTLQNSGIRILPW